jgi:hypothetical protein
MQVVVFLSARPLLTRFQGVLVYTLDGPTGFELVRGEDADLDVFT